MMPRPALHHTRVGSIPSATGAILLCAAIFISGCGTSSSISETSPDVVKCQVSLSTPPMMDSAGGAGKFSVTTQPECAWDVSTAAAWITGLSPANGQGTHDVDFRVAVNDGAAARDGDIVVNNSRVRVSQRAPCRYDVAPATQDVAVSGGPATVTVTSASECAWTATTDVGWITLTPPMNGSGTGTVNFTVAPTTNGRTGGVLIAGQRATVTQVGPGGGCTFSVAPTNQSIAAAGGPGTPVTVSTQGGCNWSAVSNVPWVTIVTGASGVGNGSVTFTVAANTGASRSGTLTIAGTTFTVSQAAVGAPPCTFSIAPTNQNAPSTATTGTINVTAGTGCAWTASSNVPWLTVTSGAAGAGNGVVGYSVAANTGAQRTGTLTVAGQTFSVTQAAFVPACTYAISPTSDNPSSAGSSGTVTVTTTAGCTWTAASNAPWITITSGATGSGNGAVGVTVAANTGAQRTGTATIAGQTYTVTQAAFVPACTYSIAPTGANAPDTASTGTVNVTTTAGCAWTAASNAPWITITSGATGSGSGAVGYNIAANTGAQRTGTATIAGQTFTVTQAAVACTYSIAPTTQNAPDTASTGTVNVTAGVGCTWAATSNAPWITITAGATGSGNGAVAFSIAANTGAVRTGTMTIAGQTFTVTQAATPPPPCTYSIAPLTQNIDATGGVGSVAITTTAGCAWTATSNAPWITINSAASGSGSGTVTFIVATNTGTARTGTLTVAGQTATVQQAGN